MEETVQAKLSTGITRWAGDLAFLTKIQRQIDVFVWAGKSRVDRNTITKSKAKGGMGLLSVMDQFRSIAGNLMIWLLSPGKHPLREILCAHIGELLRCKWGYADLTWLVTKGGSTDSGGSAPWHNICRAWAKLKPLLSARQPCNLQEWYALSLWRAHCNYPNPQNVKCSTRAQHSLRHAGLHYMGDILSPAGHILQWQDLPANVTETRKVRASMALIADLQPHPIIEATLGPQAIYFAESLAEL